ncbi:MAG: hypothetical protein Q4E69_01550 [Bacilli bacterium]|nr:hypothetical protein [Bacilli bacterium]
MENNEFNNNEENKIEEAVVQEPNKSKKKTAIILVIGLVTFILVMSIGIGIFWIKSFDGTSKTGHTKSPFSTSNKDTSNTNTSDDNSSNSKGNSIVDNSNNTAVESSDSYKPVFGGIDFSNYEVDPDIKNLALFLAFYQPNEGFNGSNILDSATVRLMFTSKSLDYSGMSRSTTDRDIQPSSVVEFDVYKNMFISIYGNNYDFDTTVSGNTWGGAVYDLCTSYASVNDGKHVCWNRTGPSNEIFFVISSKTVNEITGNYYAVNGEIGSFIFTYTDGKYLKSVVLTKTN